MLRYFYIICLLICIEWSFCYEYISDNKSPVQIRKNTRLKHRKQKSDPRPRRHESEDKDPVAQIDIASFIQQPDPEYESVDDNNFYTSNKKRRLSKEAGNYDSLSAHLPQEDEQKEGHAYNAPFGVFNPYGITAKNPFPDESAGMLHKQEKKSYKSQMKLPFFSRKKTVPPKSKKNKKRKIFSFHAPRTTDITTSLPKINESNSVLKNSHIGYRIHKRAEGDRFCPLCKRKIVPKAKSKVSGGRSSNGQKMVHNSRQYYQEAAEFTKSKQKKNAAKIRDLQNGEVDDRFNGEERAERKYVPEERRKREESERDRQLKELEEVQKKIDNVEIATPNFQKNNRVYNSNNIS